MDEEPKHFFTMIKLMMAARAGDLSTALCKRHDTGEEVTVICIVKGEDASGALMLEPIAKLFEGDPYDEVAPPQGAKLGQPCFPGNGGNSDVN